MSSLSRLHEKNPSGAAFCGGHGAVRKPAPGIFSMTEWLAKLVGELFADDARDDVGAAAWSGGDDVGDRPRRIVLREGRRRETIAAASAL